MRSLAAVIHIPHSSSYIPDRILGQYLLGRREIKRELLLMTDWFTGELFALPLSLAVTVKYPVSRLVVDPERFRDDAEEAMSAKGMGAVYERTSDQKPLRRPLCAGEREALLEEFYDPHHRALERAVEEALARSGRCVIIDGHSFPDSPLPYEDDQRSARPQICIGTDVFHTPAWLGRFALEAFRREFGSAELDRPFSGALVPQRFYEKDDRVLAVMIEVNRSLYMDERSGERLPYFEKMQQRVERAVAAIIEKAA